MAAAGRKLDDLRGVGRATLRDLRLLGIHDTKALAKSEAEELYDRLCRLTGQKHDICCLDVFRCAIAQSRDSDLPAEQCNWWYWSRQRKLC